MKLLFHLIVLAVGFFGGIYVGLHMPQQAKQFDDMRATQQAKIQPQIDAAVAKAKIELYQRFSNMPDTSGTAASAAPAGNGFVGGNGFMGGGKPASVAQSDVKAQFAQEMQQEQQKLVIAQGQLKN